MVKHLTTKRSFSLHGILLRFVDVLIVGWAFMAAHEFYGGSWGVSAINGYAAIVSACAFLIVAHAFGVYKPVDHSLAAPGYGTLATAWLATLSVVLLIAYATKTSSTFSRVAVANWMLATPLLLVLARIILKTALSNFFRGESLRTIAIAGSGENASRFVGNVNATPEFGMRVGGIYADDPSQVNNLLTETDVNRGCLQDLVADAKQGLYDEIYIALAMQEEEKISNLIGELSDCSIPVYFVPDIFTMNLMISQVYHLKNIPIVSVYDTPMDALDVYIKRLEDIVLSVLILSLIAFPMLLIAAAIKLTSSGPVLFKQRRYGLGGEPIEVWKFRSMTVCDDGVVVVQAQKNDSRLTPIGAFLRKTSLDELPQFINVIQGSMSIVGPRPHAVAHNELYRKDIQGYMLRHLVKPGITGWAQINGWRGETDTLEKMQKRVEYDLEYIRRWSLWFDLKIIGLTVVNGFIHKNAY